MNNKQLAVTLIFCTIVQLCAIVACTLPERYRGDPRFDTPKYYRNLRPYFKNGGKIIRITDIYIVKGVWYYEGKPLIVDKSCEKDFVLWVEGWQEYAGGKGNKK